MTEGREQPTIAESVVETVEQAEESGLTAETGEVKDVREVFEVIIKDKAGLENLINSVLQGEIQFEQLTDKLKAIYRTKKESLGAEADEFVEEIEALEQNKVFEIIKFYLIEEINRSLLDIQEEKYKNIPKNYLKGYIKSFLLYTLPSMGGAVGGSILAAGAGITAAPLIGGAIGGVAVAQVLRMCLKNTKWGRELDKKLENVISTNAVKRLFKSERGAERNETDESSKQEERKEELGEIIIDDKRLESLAKVVWYKKEAEQGDKFDTKIAALYTDYQDSCQKTFQEIEQKKGKGSVSKVVSTILDVRAGKVVGKRGGKKGQAGLIVASLCAGTAVGSVIGIGVRALRTIGTGRKILGTLAGIGIGGTAGYAAGRYKEVAGEKKLVQEITGLVQAVEGQTEDTKKQIVALEARLARGFLDPYPGLKAQAIEQLARLYRKLKEMGPDGETRLREAQLSQQGAEGTEEESRKEKRFDDVLSEIKKEQDAEKRKIDKKYKRKAKKWAGVGAVIGGIAGFVAGGWWAEGLEGQKQAQTKSNVAVEESAKKTETEAPVESSADADALSSLSKRETVAIDAESATGSYKYKHTAEGDIEAPRAYQKVAEIGITSAKDKQFIAFGHKLEAKVNDAVNNAKINVHGQEITAIDRGGRLNALQKARIGDTVKIKVQILTDDNRTTEKSLSTVLTQEDDDVPKYLDKSTVWGASKSKTAEYLVTADIDPSKVKITEIEVAKGGGAGVNIEPSIKTVGPVASGAGESEVIPQETTGAGAGSDIGEDVEQAKDLEAAGGVIPPAATPDSGEAGTIPIEYTDEDNVAPAPEPAVDIQTIEPYDVAPRTNADKFLQNEYFNHLLNNQKSPNAHIDWTGDEIDAVDDQGAPYNPTIGYQQKDGKLLLDLDNDGFPDAEGKVMEDNQQLQVEKIFAYTEGKEEPDVLDLTNPRDREGNLGFLAKKIGGDYMKANDTLRYLKTGGNGLLFCGSSQIEVPAGAEVALVPHDYALPDNSLALSWLSSKTARLTGQQRFDGFVFWDDANKEGVAVLDVKQIGEPESWQIAGGDVNQALQQIDNNPVLGVEKLQENFREVFGDGEVPQTAAPDQPQEAPKPDAPPAETQSPADALPQALKKFKDPTQWGNQDERMQAGEDLLTRLDGEIKEAATDENKKVYQYSKGQVEMILQRLRNSE